MHAASSISDLAIHFDSGKQSELLLQVPLAGPNELPPDAKIRITASVRPPAGDNDPWIGITDGTTRHRFAIVNDGTPGANNVLQCGVHSTEGKDDRVLVNVGSMVPSEYTILFNPFHRYGHCANNGGYSTAAKFTAQLDVTKGLSFFVQRDFSTEMYDFHQFLIEIV